MDEYDGFIKIKIDDFNKLPIFKDNIAVISCHLKILYVHTNIFEIKDQEIEEDEKISLLDSNENNSSTICDITKITQKLDCTEVNQLKYYILNPNIDISQEEINSIQNVIISESSEKKLMILAEDASYWLKIRLKWQKLSTDQILSIQRAVQWSWIKNNWYL